MKHVWRAGFPEWNYLFAIWMTQASENQWAAARKLAFEDAMSLPGNSPERFWLVGWIDAWVGDFDGAEKHLKPSIKSDSRDALDLLFWSVSLLKAGKSKLAARPLERAQRQLGFDEEKLMLPKPIRARVIAHIRDIVREFQPDA